jgi:hypothetical protein
MFGAVRCNPVYAARLTFLTTREGNGLSRLRAWQEAASAPRRTGAVVASGTVIRRLDAVRGPARLQPHKAAAIGPSG